MATISELAVAIEMPLPWKTQPHDCYMNPDWGGEPLELVAANGDTVANNVSYYAERVEPEAMRIMERAVNAHDALVAALEEARLFLDDAGYGAMDRVEAALALARKGGK